MDTRATIGHNSAAAGETLPGEDNRKNIRVHIANIQRALASRKQASDLISDATKENKAHGIPTKLVRLGLRLDALTDFEREMLLRPSKQFMAAKDQLRSLSEERKEVSREVTEAYAEAKADGHNEQAIRFVIKLSALDGEEREELFAHIDQYATFLRLW